MLSPKRFAPTTRLALLIAGLAVAFVPAVAVAAIAAGPPRSSPEAQHLRAIERARLQALVSADMPNVERLLADDFRLIPPPGFPLSREEYVAALAAGELDYLAFEPISPIDVHLFDDAAVLTYESHIDIVAGGDRLAHDAWHTYLYEKRRGQWQVVWEQATAVGGFPPPG
jgi:hypothetical protein